MPITQTLPLALTPEAHPAGIPAFLYPEAEGLLIPSFYQRVPTDRNLLTPSGFSLGCGKEHYLSNNSIILKDDRSV